MSANHRKSTQVHARPGQTESQEDPSFQLASTCESVWPGLYFRISIEVSRRSCEPLSCVFLSPVNQDFFRAAATRNPVINIAGKKDSCNFFVVIIVVVVVWVQLF